MLLSVLLNDIYIFFFGVFKSARYIYCGSICSILLLYMGLLQAQETEVGWQTVLSWLGGAQNLPITGRTGTPTNTRSGFSIHSLIFFSRLRRFMGLCTAGFRCPVSTTRSRQFQFKIKVKIVLLLLNGVLCS